MRRLVLTLLLMTTGAALLARPQSAPPQTSQPAQQPSFRAGIDLVQLDVSVLDKNRQPVRGLTKDDFTVLENGAPRTVDAFAAIDLPDAEATTNTATWMRDVTPDVTTNLISDTGRVFVIVIDDALMPTDLGAIEIARKGAANFVGRMRSDDLAAIVFTLNGRGAQPLTSDRAKLLTAVNSLSRIGNSPLGVTPDLATKAKAPKVQLGSVVPTCKNYVDSVAAIRDAADYLATLKGRRKAVIYISGGAAIDPMNGVVGPAYPSSGDPLCGVVVDAVHDALANAARANVVIYGIDPMGLRTDAHLASPSGSVVAFLQAMSDNTGGHAIVNTNDLEPGIQQIFRENSSYYLLGYRPASTAADGSIKRLEVKVNRRDVEVVSRRLYYAPKPTKANATPPPANVTALSEIVPKSDWPMRIAVMPLASGANGVAAIALGLERPAPHERVSDSVELTIKAFTPEGDARGSFDETVPVSLPPSRESATQTEYDILASLPLKPGRYQLRVSAHSKLLDTRGSVYADVEVPDFARAPLSFSGVLVTAAPGLTAAPRLVLAPIVPVVPTSARVFATSDHVSTLLRVYQKDPQAMTVEVRIVDAHDQTVVSQRVSLTPPAFAARGFAEIPYALPMAKLPPGDYLLTFEGTVGKAAARRDVKFSVK